jgi:hypothetical protein
LCGESGLGRPSLALDGQLYPQDVAKNGAKIDLFPADKSTRYALNFLTFS